MNVHWDTQYKIAMCTNNFKSNLHIVAQKPNIYTWHSNQKYSGQKNLESYISLRLTTICNIHPPTFSIHVLYVFMMIEENVIYQYTMIYLHPDNRMYGKWTPDQHNEASTSLGVLST